MSLTVAGTLEEFDGDRLKQSLATQLQDVEPADIVLEIAPASVAVNVTIIPRSDQATDAALATLSTFSRESLSVALNVTVETMERPVAEVQLFGPSNPPPAPPPTVGAVLGAYAVGAIAALLGMYFVVVWIVSCFTEIADLDWFSNDITEFFVGPRISLYFDLVCMAADFFSDLIYLLAKVLDTGYQSETLMYLSIVCLTVPTASFSVFLGVPTSFCVAACGITEGLFTSACSLIEALGDCLLSRFKEWRALSIFVAFVFTRVLWLGLTCVVLVCAVLLSPTVLVLWLLLAFLMLLLGMELKLFALKPFQRAWESILMKSVDDDDQATIRRQTLALNSGILFHLVAESLPELAITFMEEQLTPEELRWSAVAIASVAFSSLTLVAEVWPIFYNICKTGSIKKGLQVPNLSLSREHEQIKRERRSGRSFVSSSRNLVRGWSSGNLGRVAPLGAGGESTTARAQVAVGRPVRVNPETVMGTAVLERASA